MKKDSIKSPLKTDYLRMKQPSHAQETRTLRSGRNQARQDQVERVRHLPGSNEAKAQPQVKPLGSLLRVTAPAIQAERDLLFDKYLQAYDNYQRWKAKAVPVYTTNRSIQYGNEIRIDTILKRHLDEISDQLIRYDERINAATTSGPLFY